MPSSSEVLSSGGDQPDNTQQFASAQDPEPTGAADIQAVALALGASEGLGHTKAQRVSGTVTTASTTQLAATDASCVSGEGHHQQAGDWRSPSSEDEFAAFETAPPASTHAASSAPLRQAQTHVAEPAAPSEPAQPRTAQPDRAAGPLQCGAGSSRLPAAHHLQDSTAGFAAFAEQGDDHPSPSTSDPVFAGPEPAVSKIPAKGDRIASTPATSDAAHEAVSDREFGLPAADSAKNTVSASQQAVSALNVDLGELAESQPNISHLNVTADKHGTGGISATLHTDHDAESDSVSGGSLAEPAEPTPGTPAAGVALHTMPATEVDFRESADQEHSAASASVSAAAEHTRRSSGSGGLAEPTASTADFSSAAEGEQASASDADIAEQQPSAADAEKAASSFVTDTEEVAEQQPSTGNALAPASDSPPHLLADPDPEDLPGAAHASAASNAASDDGFGDFEDAGVPDSPCQPVQALSDQAGPAHNMTASSDHSDDGFGDFEDAPEADPASESVPSQPAPVQPPRTPEVAQKDVLDLHADQFLAAARALFAPWSLACVCNHDSQQPVTLMQLHQQLQHSLHSTGRSIHWATNPSGLAGHIQVQPIPWSGSKAETRLLERLGLAKAARAAAAQAAAEQEQALSRSRRMARRTTSDDADRQSKPLQSFLSTVTTEMGAYRSTRASADLPDTEAQPRPVVSPAADVIVHDQHFSIHPSSAGHVSQKSQQSRTPTSAPAPSTIQHSIPAPYPAAPAPPRPAPSLLRDAPAPVDPFAHSMHAAALYPADDAWSQEWPTSQPSALSKIPQAADDPFVTVFPIESLQARPASEASASDWGEFEGEQQDDGEQSLSHSAVPASSAQAASQNGNNEAVAGPEGLSAGDHRVRGFSGSIDLGSRKISGYVCDIPVPDLTFMLPASIRATRTCSEVEGG